MKLLHRIFAAAAGIMALSSCVQDALEPLTGMYEKPGTHAMTQVLSQPVEKTATGKVFVVEIATEGVKGTNGKYEGTGSVLYLECLSDGYKLASTTYTASAADKAKSGNYVVGKDASAFYTVSNGQASARLLDNGGISLTETPEGYTVEGTIWLEDGEAVQLSGIVKLVYVKELTSLNTVQQCQVNTDQTTGNPTSITLALSTGTYTSTMNPDYSTSYNGEGFYLGIDFFTSDGYLHPGVYTPSAKGGEIKAGNYGIGWDPGDIYNIGIAFTDWGTCWWKVADGKATAQKISKGNIVVELDAENNYTITLDNGDIYTVFKGQLPAVTPVKAGEYKLEQAFNAINNAPYGRSTVSVKLATKDLKAAADKNGVLTFSGAGSYVSLELYSADGTIVPGVYTDSTAVAEKKFLAGYVQDEGTGVVNGSFFTTVEKGYAAGDVKLITDGTVEVTKTGDNYTIVAKFDGNTATYEGPIKVVTPVVKAPGITELEMTQLLSSKANYNLNEYYQPVGDPISVTVKLATEGITTTTKTNDYGQPETVIGGNGEILAIDFFTTDGYLHEGTYKPSAVGGVVKAGEFSIGYDANPAWGAAGMNWGTCIFGYDADAQAYAEKISEGTITVKKEGYNYVITYESDDYLIEYVGGVGVVGEPLEATKFLMSQVNATYDENGQPTGIKSLTVKLGTDGLAAEEVDMGFFKYTAITGTGKMLAFDIYTEDGTLAAGVYKPSLASTTDAALGKGEFSVGFEVNNYGQIQNWGTCAFELENSAEVAVSHVLDGTLTVDVKDDVYTIILNSTAVYAKYEGKLSAE